MLSEAVGARSERDRARGEAWLREDEKGCNSVC
jgi:hypothetical protein